MEGQEAFLGEGKEGGPTEPVDNGLGKISHPCFQEAPSEGGACPYSLKMLLVICPPSPPQLYSMFLLLGRLLTCKCSERRLGGRGPGMESRRLSAR